MDDVIQAISTIGFPIVACIGACLFIYNDRKVDRDEESKREERFFKQLTDFNDTLSNFNATLQTIDKRLAQLEEKLK